MMTPGRNNAFNSNNGDRIIRFEWLFILYALLIFYATTVPFDFGLTIKSIANEWHQAEKIPFLQEDYTHVSGSDMLVNILFFIPFGFFLYATLCERKRQFAHPLRLVVIASLLFSLFIETFQLLLNDRYTSINDLISNTAGGGLGALVARSTYRQFSEFAERLMRSGLKNPLWALWAALLAIQTFLVLAPFRFEFKLQHLGNKLSQWLRSWGHLPYLSENSLSQYHLETFLLALLIAGVFFAALSRQPRMSRRNHYFLVASLFAYYPLLSLVTLSRSKGRPDAALLVLGIFGCAVGFLIFGVVLKKAAARDPAGRVAGVYRKAFLVIYSLLFATHFFFPFQVQGWRSWGNPTLEKQWLHIIPDSGLLSSKFILAMLCIFWLMIPFGYVYSQRIRMLDLKDRIIRITWISFILGSSIEFLQSSIPGQHVEPLAVIFFIIGGMAGVLLESWWRRWRSRNRMFTDSQRPAGKAPSAEGALLSS